MTGVAITQFPLTDVNESDLQRLSQVLWSWSFCERCEQGKACVTESCDWQRAKRLKPYFDRYKVLTASYEPEDLRTPAMSTHKDLLEIIRRLKANADEERAQLTSIAFRNRPTSDSLPPMEDQRYAINLAVKIMTMINCSAQQRNRGLIEQGTFGLPWHDNISLSQFIIDIFPAKSELGRESGDIKPPLTLKDSLRATNLKESLGLKFRGTDDLRMHLILDRNEYVVYIYHHTAFLKENLRLTKDKPMDTSISETLEL